MLRAYYIVSHDGIEVIDATPNAKNRISAMDNMERLYKRKICCKRKKQKLQKSILQKFNMHLEYFEEI